MEEEEEKKKGTADPFKLEEEKEKDGRERGCERKKDGSCCVSHPIET